MTLSRLPVSKTHKLFIGGKFPRSESGRVLPYSGLHTHSTIQVAWASRKDLRDAVTAALAARESWAKTTAYLRGQILYRLAEVIEGRFDQWVHSLQDEGESEASARKMVSEMIDRVVHFAGFSDKYQQILSSVNPVSSSHFNFSVPEPVGVVGLLPREEDGLLAQIDMLLAIVVGGNVAVHLSSQKHSLSLVTLSECIATSDVPSGVVNILTGKRTEILPWSLGHQDIHALCLFGRGSSDADEVTKENEALASGAVSNLKRISIEVPTDSVHKIRTFQEIKTVWHPVGY